MELTPVEERPRERCLRRGASSLSLRECLALILGTGPRGVGCLGLAQRLLESASGGCEGEQERAFFLALEESPRPGGLSEMDGLAEASRARLEAVFELARRYAQYRADSQRARPDTSCGFSQLALRALEQVPAAWRSAAHEWFGFVPCYRGIQMGKFCAVAHGSRNRVAIDPVDLFARLLPLRPAAFFLVHNHPSGDLRESEEDRHLTSSVQELAGKFGIQVLGHWIVTAASQRWFTPGRGRGAHTPGT